MRVILTLKQNSLFTVIYLKWHVKTPITPLRHYACVCITRIKSQNARTSDCRLHTDHPEPPESELLLVEMCSSSSLNQN